MHYPDRVLRNYAQQALPLLQFGHVHTFGVPCDSVQVSIINLYSHLIEIWQHGNHLRLHFKQR